jgi:hypothetical protein
MVVWLLARLNTVARTHYLSLTAAKEKEPLSLYDGCKLTLTRAINEFLGSTYLT